MKTNNKNSIGRLKPFPNNLNSGTPIQETIRKVVKRWKSQFIVSGAFVVLAILTFLEHRLDLPHLLTGTPPFPVNWMQIAFDLVTIFLVGFASVLMLSALQSKRKSGEEALRESEEQYKALIEAAGRAGEGIIIIQDNEKGETVFVFVNDLFCRMSGYSQEELIGRSPWDLIPPEISTRLKDWHERRHRGESLPAHYEAAGVRKDGMVVPLDLSIVTMPWQGKIATVLYLRDITERKKAEEALRESEEFSLSLLNNSPNPIIVINTDTSVRYVNPALEKLTGFSSAEIIGKKAPYLWWTEETLKKTSRDLEEAMSNGAHRLEELFQRKNGERFRVEITSTPVRSNGELKYYLANWLDITERKRAEEALRQSEENFKALAENANDGILIGTGEEGWHVYANRRAVEITGYPIEELLKTRIRDLVPPNELPKLTERYKKRLAGLKVPKPYETALVNKDGIKVPIEISPSRTIWQNQLVDMVIFRDITERKRAEETLKRERDFSQSILETANSMIVCLDGDAKITVFNQECERVTGYRREEVLGSSWPELFLPPDQRHPQLKSFAKWVRAHPRDQYEGPIVTKTGEIRTMLWSNTAILGSDEGEVVAIAIGHDITKRKRAEEALKESEEKFRTLAESAQCGITIFQGEKSIFNNPAVTSYTGYTEEELEHMNFWDMVRPDFKELVKERGKSRQEGKPVPARYEIPIVTKNNEERWIDISVGTCELSGKPAVISIAFDITERKRAEEALRKTETYLRAVLSNAPITIFAIDSQGLFTLSEGKGLERVGLKPGENVGVSALDLYAKTSFVEYNGEVTTGKDIIQRVLAGETVNAFDELRGVYFDNHIGPIWDRDGKIVGIVGVATDITERKRAEEALRQSEEKYRELAESITDVFFAMDRDLRYTYWNKASENLTGISAQDALGKSLCDIFPDTPQTKQAEGVYLNVSKTKKPQTFVNEYHLGGKDFVFEISAYPSKDGLSVFTKDITERKRAEEEIKAEKEFSEKLISTANAIIVGLDREHRIQLFSEGAERITGYQAEEVMGKDWFEIFFKKEMYPEMIKVWKDAWGKDLYSYTNPIYSKAGKEIIAQWSNTSIVNEKKEPILLLCIAVDITERKQAEEKIRKLGQYLETIIDNANVWLDVLDEKANVTIWNKAAEQISGYSREEVVGHGKIWEWLYPDERYRKEITTKAAAIIEKGERVEDFETTIRCKNGEIKIISWHSRDLLGADGKPIGSIALGRDITEKKKMEAQLIQSERLTAVGTLAYGIAHEFNNILAGILGNAEFGMENDDPQEMKECFQIIMEGCDRAKNITNSLLAFSRQRETKKQRADVTEAVETVLGLVERELEKQNIKVVRKFDAIPEITCDLGELSGVVLNMITNARDAMRPKGGTLTIEIGEKGDNIEMIFTDTGCGIPDNIKSRIFEPFVTTKGALGQSEIPGTGLGLFLSYGIISRYKGEIKVKSEVGKGSKFTIRIPISKNQESPILIESEEEKPTAVPQNLNILLVDDEKPICTAIKKFFEAKGHSITTALSGKKGLKVFKKGEFDLVLADIIMPDMDGVELISKLKKIDKHAKFIVLTGHVAEEKLEKAKKAGADQIMMKPFRNEELYQAIGRVLSI